MPEPGLPGVEYARHERAFREHLRTHHRSLLPVFEGLSSERVKQALVLTHAGRLPRRRFLEVAACGLGNLTRLAVVLELLAACGVRPRGLQHPAATRVVPVQSTVVGHAGLVPAAYYDIKEPPALTDLDVLGRAAVVIVNPWEQTTILDPVIATHPGIHGFIYQDWMSTRTTPGIDDPTKQPSASVISFKQALDHPDWFLLDKDGHLIEWSGYPGQYQMDPANAEYQRAVIATLLARARKYGWRQILFDNVLTTLEYYLADGIKPVKYENPSDLQAATYSMLKAVSGALRSRGIELMCNIADGARFGVFTWGRETLWFDENYVTLRGPSTGSRRSGDDWLGQARAVALYPGNVGAFCSAGAPGDLSGFRYALGTFALFAADGKAFGGAQDDLLHPEFGWTLGFPDGAATEVGDHVFVRSFGDRSLLVAVNGGTNPAAIEFDRPHRTPEGTPVATRIQLPPTTAGFYMS